jgi:CheY-like chemotaxis protein
MAYVLLIEDDPHVSRLLSTILAHYNHTVSCADNGAVGLRKLRSGFPAAEIVVTDILMPVKEGIETIMTIRRENRTIPIIAISGGGRTKRLDFLDAAQKLGANAVLEKPFRPKELIDLIETLLLAEAS